MQKKLFLSLTTLGLAAVSGCGGDGGTQTHSYSADSKYKSQFKLSPIDADLPELFASVKKTTLKSHSSSFEFTDINFENLGGNKWKITNYTPQPLRSLVVRLNNNKLSLLDLSAEIQGYTEAELDFPTETVTSLSYSSQSEIFLPIIRVDNHKDSNCVTKSTGTCYNDLNDDERNPYLNIVTKIKESFNRRSFSKALDDFFIKNCTEYSNCKDYKNEGLSYGTKTLLTLGAEGHELGLYSMRREYAALGMGGGSMPNIDKYTVTSGGWASIWEGRFKPGYDANLTTTYDTLFHEIGHAYGYGHDSGITYGFAGDWANTYIQENWSANDRKNISKLRTPELAIDISHLSTGVALLKAYKTISNKEPINIEIINVEDSNITVEKTSIGNELFIKFNNKISTPTYIRVGFEGSDYLSTIKIDASVLFPI